MITGHTNQVYSVAFSPNNAIIISASYDFTIKVWNASTYELITTLLGNGIIISCVNTILLGHTDALYQVKFSPDGTKIISCSNDKTLKLWNIISY